MVATILILAVCMVLSIAFYDKANDIMNDMFK